MSKKIPLTPFVVIVCQDDFPLSLWERAGGALTVRLSLTVSKC